MQEIRIKFTKKKTYEEIGNILEELSILVPEEHYINVCDLDEGWEYRLREVEDDSIRDNKIGM